MPIELREGKSPGEILSDAERTLRGDSDHYTNNAAIQRAKHPNETASINHPAVANEALAEVYGKYASRVAELKMSLRRDELRAITPHYRELSDSELDEIIRRSGDLG